MQKCLLPEDSKTRRIEMFDIFVYNYNLQVVWLVKLTLCRLTALGGNFSPLALVIPT